MIGDATDRRRHALASAAVALGLPAAATAQQDPPAAAPASPAPDAAVGGKEEIVVTARRLRGSVIGDVQPIAVLNQEAIRSLGATSLTELVKRLGPLTSSASGGDPVFLLNGRRVSGFSELQDIPPEAMERTEILPEQEAARFGFPSTVRVINFVTRKRFRALAVQELAGATTGGGGGTNYAEAIATRIDGPRRTSLSISHLRENSLRQDQRDIVPDPDILFATGGNVTGTAGGSIDPALDALLGRPVRVAAVPSTAAARRSLASYAATADAPAITDPGPYRTLQPRTDTVNLNGTIALPVSKTISASLNLTLQSQRSAGLNGLAPALLDVGAGNPALPFADDVLLYRYLPAAVLRQSSSNLNLHAGGTLQGSVRRWGWNVTTSYDRIRSTAVADQGVPLAGLQAAIDAGGDPLMAIDPAMAAERIANRSRTLTGTLVGKAVANGPVLRLPAGDALVTVSADYARSASDGSQPGLADATPRLARTTRGASVNADLPITSPDKDVLGFVGRLAVNGMIGVSDVSDYGRLVSSSYGLTWAPARPVQFSASVNDARTPPAIALLTGAILTSPNTPFFDFTTGTSVLATTVSGGNPALAPERRRVTTLGIALTPIKDKEFHVSLDYLDTRIADQTAYLGSLTAEFQSAFPDLFVRGSAGELIRADLRPVNIASEIERKLRMTVNLWTQLGRAPPPPPDPSAAGGTAPPPPPPKPRPSLFVFATTTWRLDDRLALRPGSPSLDLLDGATLSGTGGRPRWEMEGNLGGSYGALNLGVFGRLQGATRVRGDLAASDLRFSGRTWLVVYGSLDAEHVVHRPWARKVTLNLTVENLLADRIAVRDRTGATLNRFQGAYLDPLGRSIRLGIRKLF